LSSCACSITAKGDGQVAVKGYWDAGVLFRDGIIEKDACRTNEKCSWNESVSL